MPERNVGRILVGFAATWAKRPDNDNNKDREQEQQHPAVSELSQECIEFHPFPLNGSRPA